MGHTTVGGLVLGHTVRGECGGWGRQVNMRTALGSASARIRGQAPPRFVMQLGEGVFATPDGPSTSTDNLRVSGGVEPIGTGRSQGSLSGASVDTIGKGPAGGHIVAVDGDLHCVTNRFP